MKRKATGKTALPKAPHNPNDRLRTLICSDCKHVEKVRIAKLMNKTRQRCPMCGGPLNRPEEL